MLSRCQRCRGLLPYRETSTMAASQRDRICPTCQSAAPLRSDAVTEETRTRLQFAGVKVVVRRDGDESP